MFVPAFLAFTSFASWTQSGSHLTSPLIEINSSWKELVPSWRVEATGASTAKFFITADYGDHTTRRWCVGQWSPDKGSRMSIKAQKDADGLVDTDTLILNRPGAKIRVEVETTGDAKLTGFYLIATDGTKPDLAPATVRPVGPFEPPYRAQMSYPDGDKICSPTSISMVLGYWAKTLDRPALDHDVPAVCEGVFDQNWPGTGNWPFNTSFAASIPGLRSYVTRFRDVHDLQLWLNEGVPLICSVAYDFLQGKPERSGKDGHLVVLVGFDAEGNPVFNDPGRNVVRKTYKLSDFQRAWRESANTVYLVFPRTWNIPVSAGAPWGLP